MISRTTASYWTCFDALPPSIQARAKAAYASFAENPSRPGLNFERVHPRLPFYSVRIGLRWRAVGRLEDEVIVWFWIGPHHEYDKLLRAL